MPASSARARDRRGTGGPGPHALTSPERANRAADDRVPRRPRAARARALRSRPRRAPAAASARGRRRRRARARPPSRPPTGAAPRRCRRRAGAASWISGCSVLAARTAPAAASRGTATPAPAGGSPSTGRAGTPAGSARRCGCRRRPRRPAPPRARSGPPGPARSRPPGRWDRPRRRPHRACGSGTPCGTGARSRRTGAVDMCMPDRIPALCQTFAAFDHCRRAIDAHRLRRDLRPVAPMCSASRARVCSQCASSLRAPPIVMPIS